MLIRLYCWITWILYPLFVIYLIRRRSRGKEDVVRFNERLGKASISPPSGDLLWFHAASVGEVNSVLPLIKEIQKRYPHINTLLTSGTVSSAKILAKSLPAGAIHQYVPVDSIVAVKRFLRTWQPKLAIFLESELWPNLINQTSQRCPVIILNGRLSDQSYRRWQKLPKTCEDLFSKITFCMPQSRLDEERFNKLGMINTCYLGNLKYSCPPLEYNKQELERFKSLVKNRTVIIAASTHKGEEEIVLKAHLQLKSKYPNLLTILVPRHPYRRQEIQELAAAKALEIKLRSEEQIMDENTDIYLVDTLGELGLFYQLGTVVFIGGSLIAIGGHNPLEPSHYNSAIIMGPYIFNFSEITAEFAEKNAIIIVHNVEEFTATLEELLQNTKRQQGLALNARNLVLEKNILDQIVQQLDTFILANFTNF